MARMALERAIESGWVDEVFAALRQQQYPRELLFPRVAELMSLGLRPSLHTGPNRRVICRCHWQQRCTIRHGGRADDSARLCGLRAAISALAPSCKNGTTQRPVSSYASTPGTHAWSAKARGKPAW